MTTPTLESKRIRRLRKAIIDAVPRFPDNKASLSALQQQSLGSLLIVYLSWRLRFVSQNLRSIKIRESASQDFRWPKLKPGVDSFLDKVRRGEDLTPHLSYAAWRRGYTPPKQMPGKKTDLWEDKDFLLNVMGFHHFHLGTKLEKKGFVTRTKDVLFAHVTRSHLDVIGIFDHSVFENKNPADMPEERKRLWTLYDEILFEGIEPGTAVLANPISASGHPSMIVMLALHYAKVINRIDSQLDDRSYLETMIYGGRFTIPKNPKLRWAFKHLDLFLADDATNTCFVIQRGPA